MRVLTVIGTRPEAVKLAPVILELRRREGIVSRVCLTSQHTDLVTDVLALFGIAPDCELPPVTASLLTDTAGRLLRGLGFMFMSENPDVVVVEGDTTTVLAAALAGYYAGVPVAHVEAGLRSGDLRHPWPEEGHRRMVSTIASLHLAPTEHARRNLLAEGVPDAAIFVTGNPGIDALRLVRGEPEPTEPDLILATVHRRETRGPELDTVCRALARLAGAGLRVVLPVHPSVHEAVWAVLGGVAGVQLVEPMAYPDMVRLLGRCALVLTDSGGLQEEAPAMGKPVLVMRETTERPEGVEAGVALVVGRSEDGIVEATLGLLRDPVRYAVMARVSEVYGDGHAAEHIVGALTGRAIAA